MRPGRQKILILPVNWLGDLLFLTPAIRAIRRAHPAAEITCLCPARGADFLKGNPHLDRVISLEEPRGWRGLFFWLALAGRLRWERYGKAFLFHRSFTRAMAVRLAGIPERIGYRTWKRAGLLTRAVDAPAPDRVHKIDLHLRLVEAAGIPPAGRHVEAGILPEDRQAAAALAAELGLDSKKKVVALHPGANWRLKRWPAGRFAELADELSRRYGAQVLFVGGPGDRSLVKGIIHRMKSRAVVATGRTTFRQMGALLERVSLLVSNDSGPLHMGLAVGAPVVALFGPTDPKLTGPQPDAKTETLFGSIGCPVPCYQLNCPANLCMEQISVDQVLEAAGKILEGSGPFSR